LCLFRLHLFIFTVLLKAFHDDCDEHILNSSEEQNHEYDKENLAQYSHSPSISECVYNIKTHKKPLTMSPFDNANKVRMLFSVVEKRSKRQKMHCPRKTNPKKKGRTPSINIKRFVLANLRVLVIKLMFGLYSRYLSIMSHATMQPSPIRAS